MAEVIPAERVVFRPATRLLWLKLVLVAGLLAGLLLSTPLWVGPRQFPFAPPVPILAAAPPVFDIVAFVALIAALAAAVLIRRPAKILRVALCLAIALALRDQMRWQPWFYQYCFMLAALALHSWKDESTQEGRAVLNTCRLIVVSLYFYSGLQKLNPEFIGWVLPWMLEPLAGVLPPALRAVPRPFGVVVPVLEIAMGIGLATRRFRQPAIALSLAMLAFVLLTLGPWGRNWNSVVWPWNVAMAIFVVILFWRTDDVSFGDVVWLRNWPFQTVVLAAFLVMPALSFANLWDSYLSATLYSGNTNRARLFITESVKRNLPVELQQYTTPVKNSDLNVLDFHTWSLRELNVPPYPEERVFKEITRGVCKYASSGDQVFVVIRGKPTLFNRDEQSVFNCADLRAPVRAGGVAVKPGETMSTGGPASAHGPP